MQLPKTIQIVDVEGGKRVFVACPDTGMVVFRSDVIFTSITGQPSNIDKYIEDGIRNGFTNLQHRDDPGNGPA